MEVANNLEPLAGENRHDRIDEERRIVRHDLGDGSRGLVSVTFESRGERSERERFGTARVEETEGALDLSEQLLRRDRGELVLGDAARVRLSESGERGRTLFVGVIGAHGY
jgi:hypothetical protein